MRTHHSAGVGLAHGVGIAEGGEGTIIFAIKLTGKVSW